MSPSAQGSGGVVVMAIGWHARGAGSILFAGDFFVFNFYTLLIIYNVISISFDHL